MWWELSLVHLFLHVELLNLLIQQFLLFRAQLVQISKLQKLVDLVFREILLLLLLWWWCIHWLIHWFLLDLAHHRSLVELVHLTLLVLILGLLD